MECLLGIVNPSLIIEAFEFIDTIRKPQNHLTVARDEKSDCSFPPKSLTVEDETHRVNAYRSNLDDGNSDLNENCCYKSTDEFEPWDLTQLNIRASLICLSSKVRSFCQRLSEKEEREFMENRKLVMKEEKVRNKNSLVKSDEVVSDCSSTPSRSEASPVKEKNVSPKKGVDASWNIKNDAESPVNDEEDSGIAMDKLKQCKKNLELEENKFCFSDTRLDHSYKKKNPNLDEGIEEIIKDEPIDWIKEIQPSMKKLRQAVDGLMRTTRLTNSALRLKQSPENLEFQHALQFRRDICFSQAVGVHFSNI